jgi:hypothetical protein
MHIRAPFLPGFVVEPVGVAPPGPDVRRRRLDGVGRQLAEQLDHLLHTTAAFTNFVPTAVIQHDPIQL